jgi:ATP-dependent Clp protease ATP-binding subunit ClpC
MAFDRIKEKVFEEAKRAFKPEFLNRINEMVVFRSLSRDHLFKIVDLELEKVCKRLAGRDILLTFDEAAKVFLIDHGYDEKFGARPLRRSVERHLEDPLAEAILRGEVRPGEPIRVTAGKEALVFQQNQEAQGTATPGV